MQVETWENDNGRWYRITSADGEEMLLTEVEFVALWRQMSPFIEVMHAAHIAVDRARQAAKTRAPL